jgi:hypothetical protein
MRRWRAERLAALTKAAAPNAAKAASGNADTAF